MLYSGFELEQNLSSDTLNEIVMNVVFLSLFSTLNWVLYSGIPSQLRLCLQEYHVTFLTFADMLVLY